MAENKKSFIIYTSWKRWLDGLNLEQKGMWLDWMLSYTNDENPQFPSDQAVMIACMMAQDTLKRDLKKYEAQCERTNRINEERKRKKLEQQQNDIDTKSLQSRNNVVCDNDNDNDNDNEVSKETNNRDINISCSKQVSSDYNFDTFWSEYPRKVGKDKCLKWFKSHKPKHDLVSKMVEAIKQQKKSKQWKDPQYIPHPYTWLNQGRWDDEIETKDDFTSQSKTKVVWDTVEYSLEEEISFFKGVQKNNTAEVLQSNLEELKERDLERYYQVKKALGL